MIHQNKPKSITFASWNILADGLSQGEFMSAEGDGPLDWKQRGLCVTKVLEDMFEQGVGIVATQENDHYFSLLQKLQEKNPNIDGLFCVSNIDKLSIAEECYARRNTERGHDKQRPNKDASNGDVSRYVQDLYVNIQNNGDIATFQDEHVPYSFVKSRMETLGLLDITSTDSYLCPDGLGVYYDTTQFMFIRAHSYASILCDKVYEYNQKCCFLEFVHLQSNVRFLVVSAHLKSGENAKAETTRCEQLKYIFDTTEQILHLTSSFNEIILPIVLMDSNTNKMYQEIARQQNENMETTHHVIRHFEYTDIIQEKHKCVKMRHAGGEQPSKLGTLMVDGIDKVMVPCRYQNAFTMSKIKLNAFIPICKQALDTLSYLRANKDKRDTLKQFVIHNECRDCMQDNWHRICELSDVDKNKWETSLGCSTDELCGALMQLYPNSGSPSDHPPVLVDCDWIRASELYYLNVSCVNEFTCMLFAIFIVLLCLCVYC